jgi:TP901 family phage tail tape measure protein
MPTLAPVKVDIIGGDQYTKTFSNMTKSLKSISSKVTATGKSLTAGLTVPIVGVAVAGIKMSNDMNKAMANVGTLIPGQRDRLEKLKQSVLDLGVATGASSQDIADGLYETISAFGSAEDPMNKLAIATRMSVAGISTVKDSLKLVSAVTKGYGDTSDAAAQQVSDMAFKTVELGQTTFPELAASIGNVVPLATTLGIKQKELFTGFATLTGVTGNASEVSTQFASALGAFIKPSADMTKTVKKLGYESSVAMVKELGLKESLNKLNEATGGSEIKLGKLLTRKEGLNLALTLLGPQSANFTEKLKQMGQAAGATDKAFAEQNDGINKTGAAFNQLTEIGRKFLVQIGDKLAPIILNILKKLQPFVDTISNLSDETLEFGLKLGGLLAAVGPVLLIVGKLGGAVSGLMALIGGAGGLGAVFAALTGPVGIAIAAVAAFTAAMIYLWDEIAPIREAVLDPIKNTIADIANVLSFSTDGASSFGASIKDLTSQISNLIAPVIKVAASLFLMPLRMIVRWVRIGIEVFSVLGKVFSTVWNVIKLGISYIATLWKEFKEGTIIGQILVSAFSTVAEVVGKVWEKIKGLWDVVTGFFGTIGEVLSDLNDEVTIAVTKQEEKTDGVKAKAEVDVKKSGTTKEDGDIIQNPQLLESLSLKEQKASFDISIKGLGQGMSAEVTNAKGGKIKLNTKGGIMEGNI